jgi:hypothetical protein
MKIFDDMTFSGSPEALGRLIARLDQSPQIGPWKRDPEAEQSHALDRRISDTTRCFRTKIQPEPDALLWLFAGEKGAGTWRVTNIVPAISDASFKEQTYYFLLISFREAVLALANELGIKITVPHLDVGPEYWLTPDEERLLQLFSRNANRSTGAAHPQDRARWNAFVIAVHRDENNVSGADIERILIEHENWPEGTAHELAIDFDKQLSLLRDFAKSA